MFCRNCGTQNEDTARFCAACGEPLIDHPSQNKDHGNPSDKKKKKKSKIPIICALIVILLALILAVGIVIKNKKSAKEYENYMVKAERYLEDLDYERAEDCYLKAIEIDSRQREPYLDLAQIYIDQEEYEKAETIMQMADIAGAKETEDTKEKEEQIKQQLEEVKESSEAASPIYYWNFAEGIGEENGLECEVSGDTQVEKVSHESIKKAAYFDGDGDYIECGTGVNLTENFTFSTWICSQDVDKKYSAFFAKYEVNHKGAYAFSIKYGHINCWITTDENGNHTEIEGTTTLKNNTWYHVSIVKEGLNFKIYINGKLDAEMDVAGFVENDDLVTIGRQALMFDPEDQLQFKGYIGEIAIYNEALTEKQLLSLYKLKEFSSDMEEKQGEIPENALEWNSHHYAVFDNGESWEQAVSYCESLGGHLATITSEEENEAVYNYMLEMGYENAYFGLYDEKEEGVWCWVNDEPVSYTNWHSGEPNGENPSEDYAMFYYKFKDSKQRSCLYL